ncbi:MAG: hypothetical protein WA996_11875 [Candidatus Promineifilaceae bacterium]
MEKIKRHLQWKSISGEPIYSGNTVITPVSKVVALRTPFFDFIWNRPHEVRVQEGEEFVTIPIADVTRIAQLAIYGFGASIAMILWLFSRKSAQ